VEKKAVLSPWQYTSIALAITLLGFGLRLYGLGSDSLWFDEILTARTAQRSFASIWTYQSEVSDHPPVLYILTHVSLQLGHSDFAVRLPSALLGVLAIPLVYRLGCSWGEWRVGLWGALLLALSPFHIQYSQEARHYAPLTTMAVASLLLLRQALKQRNRRWWVAFSIVTALSLYTHYASLIILAMEMMLVVFVLGRSWIQTRRCRQPNTSIMSSAIWLAVSLVIAIALYAPWIPSLLGHLSQNLGPEADRATAINVPITNWITNAFCAFGIGQGTSFLFGGLCLVGWIVSLGQRAWQRAWLFLIWLTVPFLLMSLMDVSRFPFPKYVAYELPIYLLSIAVGTDTLLYLLTRLWSKYRSRVWRCLAALIGSLLVLASVPAIKEVYWHIERDWKGAVQYLDKVASEGDVFITATLHLPSGFNQGRYALPYYLQKAFDTYYLLPAAHVTPGLDELEGVIEKERGVWALVFNQGERLYLESPDFHVVPFRGQLLLIYTTQSGQTTLEESIALFEAFVPFARSPQPRREILLDLVAMYNAAQRFDKASEMLELALSLDSTVSPRVYNIATDTYHGLIETHVDTNRIEEARTVAWKLLTLNSKDEAALQVLTVYDFIANLSDAEIDAPQEPFQHVDTRVFTMPQTGDWKPVLFMHPSSRASYRLTLPEEAVELRFSIAMSPESWDWGGDGSTFIVRLRSQDGEVHDLLSQLVSNAPEDRQWHSASIDLSPFAGQDVTITFATDPGPQGDFTGDWAGWGEPRIVWSQAP
jgi:mannosyltransferase